jgi:hypothetical protein
MPFKQATDDAPAARGGLTLFGPHSRAMGICGRSIVNCPPAARRDTTLRLVFCRRFRPGADRRRKLYGFRATVKGFVLFFGWMICRAAAPAAIGCGA